MDRIVAFIGSQPISLAAALAAAVLVAGVIATILVLSTRSGRRAEARAGAHFADLARTQAELSGRLKSVAEIFGSRQADLARAVTDRLDGLGHRIGQ